MKRMEKVVRKFGSHEEADASDAEEDLRLAPHQRIQILLELQAWNNPDGDQIVQCWERSPNRIDFITSTSGVEFRDAWTHPDSKQRIDWPS